MLEIGLMLGGRYEIVKHIGIGGMADVYMAKDHKLNRFVAIKVLKKELESEEKFLKKFQIEAQAVAGLTHINIVNVYDVGQENDVNYIVMELAEGVTLKEYIRKKGRLSAKETVDFSIQIARALECAHANHTIHRDIKPQNIIVTSNGILKVTDFGIAKVASSNTVTSTAIGSAHYISPEQAKGKFCDEKSDIYSLGISMYEMVTGELPFDHENGVTIALMHLQNEIVPPSELIEDIPESLEKIILKCTMKKPEERYQTAADLIADLNLVFDDVNGNYVGMVPSNDDAPTMILNTKEIKVEPEEEEDDDESGYVDDSNEEEGSGINSKIEKLIVILAAVVGAIILIAIIAFVVNGSGLFRSGDRTTTLTTTEASDETTEKIESVVVDNYIGMTYTRAKEVIGDDLTIERKYENSSSEQGTIIKQSIQSDTEVDKGTTIILTVSSGEEKVEVPDVEGYKQSEATKVLNNQGFKVSVSEKYSTSVSAGLVISQSPSGGAKVDSGTTITITVSKGSNQVEVPSLVNTSESEARAALSDAGLKVSTSSRYDDSVEAGYVISQSTAAGRKVAKGTVIKIVISLGPNSTEPETTEE